MRRITDEDHLAGELFDAGYLAEHAARVEHRLSHEDPVARTLVDQHPGSKGVEIHVHDVADDESVRDPGGIVAQSAQTLGFSLQRLVALQPELSQPQLRLESDVVRAQRIT